MLESRRTGGSLKLGSCRAVWVEDSPDWRGRAHRQYRTIDLPHDLVRPSPLEPNISDPAALQARLRALIGRDKKDEMPIALVIPDLCVRATLLQVDQLPSRPTERDALIRWRLEQESAFPMSGAKIVSQRLAPKTVLAVAIRETVLRQYETVCEAVGLSPVEVDVTSFRLWSAPAESAPIPEPVAWLSLLDNGFTFAVLDAGRPAFLRTKIQSSSGQEGVFQDLARSLALSAETHPQTPPRRLMLISEEPESALAQRATDELGLEVVQVNGDEMRRAELHKTATQTSCRINLSSIRRSYMGAVRAALVLLSLIFMGLIAWDLQQAKTIEAQVAEVEKALARVRDQDGRVQLQAKAEGLDVSDAALQRLPVEVAFANQVITKGVFSWTRFLSDLEEAVPPRVAVHSIRLDFKDSTIALGGSALTLQDLTTLIIGLEDHRAFKDAVLGRHQVRDNGLVEFTLTVRYHNEAQRS